MSEADVVKEREIAEGEDSSRSSEDIWEEVIKSNYGGIIPKKPPLLAKDLERSYFDSADWALGKQGVAKPKAPIEKLRPKLQPTQQHSRDKKSPCAPGHDEDDCGSPSNKALNQ